MFLIMRMVISQIGSMRLFLAQVEKEKNYVSK